MRLVVIANREPLRRVGGGYQVAVGGLAAALYPALRARGGVWVAWGPGGEEGRTRLDGVEVVRVPLSAREVQGYYAGLANQSLWPLFHLFLETFRYHPTWWRRYQAVNRRFAEAALAQGGEVYWVHDYHLALVPAMVRARAGSVRIGVFWHIPWPPLAVLEAFPHAGELVAGLLGADLVGFHTEDYAERFREAAVRLLGAGPLAGGLAWQGRRVRVGVFPIGVDVAGLEAAREGARRAARAIRAAYPGRKVLVGADRLDYTKGLLERFAAYARYLRLHPGAAERVVYIQLTTPSREGIPAYRRYRRRVLQAAERLARRYPGAFVHRYETLTREELFAHYAAADLALVTPLRDGMNLVAQEYAMVSDGVLLLSRFAGAARYLPEALLVNPYDTESTARAIAQGLSTPGVERARRARALRARVRGLEVGAWAEDFLRELLA